ncbi:ROK family transcriptional regulator [Palleronia rufa]|uniref:ROK family transcriptional regulator n=1 Tax=Palleronia rufa TaxID=1530186 RepID=UPI0005619FE0|nr:ROK family transcriptional regulator [Palleronia rufa]
MNNPESFRSARDAQRQMLGSNQSGVRAHNERLVLSLLRRHGPLAKAEIARLTRLSAQTVSVIMRALEADGMLLRDSPRRGRVGQPSVPLRLDPDGAYFFGATIGRRYVDLVLVDMLGRIRASARRVHGHPDFDAVADFIAGEAGAICADLSERDRTRVHGMGVAMPMRLWDWAGHLGVSPEALSDWAGRDIGAELAERTGLQVHVRNDASSACGAEMVFGTHPEAPAVMHIYIAYFIGGGLILNGQLFVGHTGNAGAIGSMPIPQPDGSTRQLLDTSSLVNLSRRLAAAGKPIEPLWEVPLDWDYAAPEVDAWIEEIAPGIAHAISVAATVIDLEIVLIDGHMPESLRSRVTAAVSRRLDAYDFAGISRPDLREGSIGASARSLGAASLPLAAQFMV